MGEPECNSWPEINAVALEDALKNRRLVDLLLFQLEDAIEPLNFRLAGICTRSRRSAPFGIEALGVDVAIGVNLVSLG